jgi:hypothetical protein
MSLPVFLSLFLTVSSLETSTHYYRLKTKDQEPITPCRRQSLEKDGLGREWTKCCYEYGKGLEETVEFLREVVEGGWTYVVRTEGERRFDYRIPLHIQLCDGEDIDAKGKAWSKVCYPNGQPVQFERSLTLPWTYLQGSGCHLCSDRRVIYQKPAQSEARFQTKPETPIQKAENPCIPLEFDTSGRGFVPDFTLDGVRIAYIKDIHGNYVWSPQSNSRIIGFPYTTETQKPSERPVPCLIDPMGTALDLQTDLFYPAFYWRKDAERSYLRSETDADKTQGMYRIDYNTGLRLLA